MAHKLAGWGGNVYVKIPVTNTQREPADDLVRRLSQSGVRVNVTAVMTLAQVERLAKCLRGGAPSNISIFAGRIADTGIDPLPMMRKALELIGSSPTIEIIWASPRELLNLVQASEIGCHIITVTADILTKLPLLGRDLDEYSLDTVKMFHGDVQQVRAIAFSRLYGGRRCNVKTVPRCASSAPAGRSYGAEDGARWLCASWPSREGVCRSWSGETRVAASRGGREFVIDRCA